MGRQKTSDTLFLKWKKLEGADPAVSLWAKFALPHMIKRCQVDSTFDPWSADLESMETVTSTTAIGPLETSWGTIPAVHHKHYDSRYLQTLVANEVASNRTLIEQEPAYGLLALKLLVRSGIAVPHWLQEVTFQPLDEIAAQSVGSLDAAYKRRATAPDTLRAAKRDLEASERLCFCLGLLVADGTRPIDDGALEEAAAIAGVHYATSKLWELYRMGGESGKVGRVLPLSRAPRKR